MSRPNKYVAPNRYDRLGAEEVNPYGTHNKWSFVPKTNALLRCPNCNTLMTADFSDEKCCPKCRKFFGRKDDWVKMSIEAEQVKAASAARAMKLAKEGARPQDVPVAGWSKEVLEDLGRHQESRVWKKDGTTAPINDVARNFLKYKVQQERALENLRNRSSVSQALRTNLKRPRRIA